LCSAGNVGKVTDSSLDSDRIEILDKVRKFAEAKLQLSAFNPGESNVPVSGKVLDPEDFVALVDSSLDGWLTAGRYTEEFEREHYMQLSRETIQTVNKRQQQFK
jgi:hypothetical protein